MRRALCIILSAILLLLFAGCREASGNEYISIVDHNAPYAYHPEATETTEETQSPIPTASNYYEMRAILLNYVTSGIEHGQLILTGYSGNLENDLKQVTKYLTTLDPVASYATDYLVCGRTPYSDGWLITVDAVYRRSVSEIQSIQPVRGNEAAYQKMRDALVQQSGSLTLQVSGYKEADFAQMLYDYCLLHPDEIPLTPKISVAVYPDSGNVRVLETHFVYEYDRETLRKMRSEADTVFSSAYSYIRYAKSDLDKLDLLLTYLTSRFPYQESEEASVYSLLCQGVSDSRSIASAVDYLCKRSGMNSCLVIGTKDELPYAWNVIQVDGAYRHFDFHAASLTDEPLAGKLDEEMVGFEWNTEAVPACVILPEEPEESDTSESTEETP